MPDQGARDLSPADLSREPAGPVAEATPAKPPVSESAALLLALQGTAGNRAVARMFDDAAAEGQATPAAAFARATAGPARAVPRRAEMEGAFGADFSGVRAHLGDPAARDGLSQLGAQAATYGSEVVFRDAAPDRELVAHELAHVVQQGGVAGGPGRGTEVSRPDSGAEQQAHAAARLVAGGVPAAPTEASAAGSSVALSSDSDAPAPGNRILRQAARVALAPPTAAEPATDEAAAKVRHALGSGSGAEVVRLDDAALATTTAAQRAGLAKILTDQLWTSQADEQVTMKLIRLKGEQAAVLGHLDVLGYRQKLLDSVDDETLHADLVGLLGAVPAAPGTGPVADALSSRKPADVLKLSRENDLKTATRAQRLGLLQIMLDLSSSNTAEENRIIDLLEAGDLAGTMAEVKALGLKQRLFDHIDDDAAKQRLTTLLQSLGDKELDADLVVFNRGFWSNVGEGIAQGWHSAVKNFSLGALVMGMLKPIIHPIDTVAKHIDDAGQVVKSPSVDGVVALLRDILGTLGMWLLVAAGVVALVGVAVSAGVITLPAGIAIEGVAGALLGAAAWCGVAFVVLAIIKALLDTGEAGAATTAQEHKDESEQIGEDITTLGVVAVLAGLLRGLGKVVKSLRGATEEPAQAEPGSLEKQAGEAKSSQAKAAEETNKLKDAADKKGGGGRAGFKPGVYDAADPANTPEQWNFKDKVTEPTTESPLRVAETEFEAPNKAKGMGRRAINTKTGELEMQEIKVDPEAKWISTDPPLVEGKGTPTAAYVSMRLMKMLKIAPGSLKVVLIKNIWNLKAILELRALEKDMPRDQAVAKTSSVTSQETALTQSGHKVTGARVKSGTGKVQNLKEVLDYWESEQETLKEPNQKVVDEHNKLLKDAGLTREQALSQEFFWDYDIEVLLEPAEPAAPGSGSGSGPAVVPVPDPNKKDGGL